MTFPAQEQTALTPEQTFERAVARHRAGELLEAVELYRTVLQSRPDHHEATHNLGAVAVQLDQPASALPLFEAALNADPARREYWISYIDALLRADRLDEARQTLTLARQYGLDGSDVDALAARLEAPPVAPPRIAVASGTAPARREKQRSAAPARHAPVAGPNQDEINAILALFNQGRFAEVEPRARALTARYPDHGFGWIILGAALKQAGRSADALEPARMATLVLPNEVDAFCNLGSVQTDLGLLDDAETSLRRALSINPRHVHALYNLGATLQKLDRLAEAEQVLRQALALEPRNIAALNNLGNVLKGLRRYDDAQACYQQALRINPHFADAHNNLGATLRELNRLEDAAACFRCALDINPAFAIAHNNLGVTLQRLGHARESEASYRRALALDPDCADTSINLGSTLIQQGRLYEAVEFCQNAVRLAPDNPLALSNLGVALQDLGHHDAAGKCFERALQLKPDFSSAMDNLLFNRNYHPDLGAEDVFATYREYDTRFGLPLRSEWKPHTNSRDTRRRLKVGYVSPDFRKHSSRHFLEPLLAHHDKHAVEVYAYAEVTQEDDVTARYKTLVDHWVPTVGLTDAELTDRIRADGIDILVDLAGHTLGHRLGVFARKPAPVSLTWMGYGNTTGLSAVDYFLTDDVAAPPGSDYLFSEKPWRIANPDIPYRPADGMGDVSALPVLQNGYVTFCTLTRRIRINHRTIRVWSEILRRVDKARLIINSRDFLDPTAQKVIEREFAAHGITRDRLLIGYQSPPWDVLRKVDIGLDCFPHNSGTTLLETLYMGVPYITLADRVRVGRIGSSMLWAAGHPEWIATTEAEYVEKAVALASDLPTLQRIRAGLRGEMRSRPLMDEAGFTRRVETAYRDMFRRWAESAPNETPTVGERLQQAVALHEAKQLQAAGELYRAILAAEPRHAKANYNMGMLAVQMHDPEAALPYFAAALDTEPERALFWIGYIDALIQARHIDDAREILALARQQGLTGEHVDALDLRINQIDSESQRAPATPPSQDTETARVDLIEPGQISRLIALMTRQDFSGAAELAHALTTHYPAHPFPWLIRGVALNHLGRHAEALGPMQRAVELAPNDANAHINLGIVHKNLGHLEDARNSYLQALRVNPDLGEAHYNLGNTLKDLHRLDEAAASYQHAVQLLPDHALIHGNLGATLQQLGQLRESETHLRRAVQLQPEFADAHFNLGHTLKRANRLDEAAECFQRAVQLNPAHAQAHLSLGSLQKALGQLGSAEESFRRALHITPDDAELHAVLGRLQTELKRFADAEASYRRALQLDPNLVEVLNNLSNILFQSGRAQEAEALLRRALELKPDFADAHFNLGNIHMDASRLVDARTCFMRTLKIDPGHLPAHQNLVIAHAYLSEFDRVVPESDATLHLDPDSAATWEQRLYAFSYHPDLSAAQIFAEFERWGARHPVPVTDFSTHDRTPGRRLRVGFVSPDFRGHTSRFYFWPMFAHHDHTVVEMFAYSNVLKEDAATAKFKTVFDHWRNIRGVAAPDVAKMIRDDRIDILVDGCNHMLDDRLDVFALKPAPIQVTWLGAAWTTGLKQIDYVLFDPVIAPEGTLASETIVRLPRCFIAYQPENSTSPVPTPALKNGYITFGYSGRTERLNHHTFRVWGEILRRVPDSKLILDFRGFDDPATQQHYRDFMRTCGMDPERVVMRRSANIFEGLNDFDVLFDSFPHSAGTMTLDGLWMSVPTLTLAGRPPLGRIGTTFLTSLGLTDWVATSHEDFIDKAVAHTRDVHALDAVRATVRPRMQASAIMDGAGFARDVEAAYRWMFERWRTS